MLVSEDQINRWASPPSDTENERCENAVRQISNALRSHFGDKIYFIRQGSHKNRTNVRLDSDIDLAVIHEGYYFPHIHSLSESDKVLHRANAKDADYSFSQFKTDVHDLLKREFGNDAIERKNKCIRVKGNSYRISADVVPAYKLKRFSSYDVIEAEGIGLVTDSPVNQIHSFPEQHYKNGVTKNDTTNRAYKSIVRIFKNIRNKFIDEGTLKLEDMPSFFIESLVWNVPDNYFNGSTWRDDAESVALKVWSDMRDANISNNYAEVSDLMWLFRGHKRTPKQAENFMLKAWLLIRK